MKADLKSAFQGETPGTAIQQTSPQNCVRVLIQTAAKAARLGDNEGLATGLEEIQKKQELYLPESVEDKKLVGKARAAPRRRRRAAALHVRRALFWSQPR